MKECFKCGVSKPLSVFYPHPMMSDGHLNKCKECTKDDMRADRMHPVKRERIRKYDSDRKHTEHRKEQVREYQINRRAKHPEKYKVHYAVSNAVRDGKLIKQPCVVCGDVNSQGHHEDYSKPLDVIWLCFKHHRELAHGHKVGAIS